MKLEYKNPSAFWDERAAAYEDEDEPWIAISVAGAPLPVARLVYRLEARGMREVERALPRPGRVLDVGCGLGRWFPLTAPGRSLEGVDVTPRLVAHAAENAFGVEVTVGDVRSLAADDGRFDAVYSSKVVQHVAPTERAAALAEMFRVTRSGGRVILYERLGAGETASDWIAWAAAAGGRLLSVRGNQYAPIERGLLRLVRRKRSQDGPGEGPRSVPRRSRLPRLYAAFTAAQWLLLALTMPLEPIFESLVPARFASHAVFVFEKP